ncbi:WD repeat domain-containing protein [Colletotrichum higginsianum]|uniref:WD repeat domain-containing protein n=1 Tax=Colletotrichum higginsianum (strain IMI 349063) TaxID=759273 RepID=H1VLB4_COLHI|nr:WD repeat domain-containing protein [Colletotrichum higginsianum]
MPSKPASSYHSYISSKRKSTSPTLTEAVKQISASSRRWPSSAADLRSDKQRKADRDLDAKPLSIEEEIKKRARGKNGALKKYLRKQRKKNIIDEKRMKVDEIWEKQQKEREKKNEVEADLGPALSRFARKE